MSPKAVRNAIVSAAVLAAALLAACGESNGLQEYLEQVGVIRQRHTDEIAAAAPQELSAGFLLSDEDREKLATFYSAGEATSVDTIAALDAVEPPDGIGLSHQRLIEGHQGMAQAFAQVRDQIDSFTTEEELLAAFRGPQNALGDACFQLQFTAQENDISVDLRC